MRIAAAILLLSLAASPAFSAGDERPVRRGPDLAAQWTEAAKTVGAVELYGFIDNERDRATVVSGRFGAGALFALMGTDSNSWSTSVRMDGREAEIEDLSTGWIIRRKIAEMKIPITEEGDLFGLLPPLRRAEYLGVSDGGEQKWEYAVRGEAIYRVWLMQNPLRMTRRDVIRDGGASQTTFIYRDHFRIHAKFALPMTVIVQNSSGEKMLELRCARLALGPALPPLPALDQRIRALYARGERIAVDTAYQRVVREIETIERDSFAVNSLVGRLNSIEDSHGVHPLIDAARARVGLLFGDVDLAGTSIRSALSMGRGVSVLAARIGAMEFAARGDSALMASVLRQSLPATQDGLTDREAVILTEVASICAEAYLAAADTAAARSVIESAWKMNPSNGDIVELLIGMRRATGDVEGAAKIVESTLKPGRLDIPTVVRAAEFHEGIGDAARAESVYRLAIAEMPEEPLFHLRLGRHLLARKRFVDAEDVFDTLTLLLERSSFGAERRAEYANEIAYMLAEAGHALRKARSLAEYALAVNGDDPFYLDTLGLVHFRSGNRIAAVMVFERALAKLDHPTIREHLERARK